MAVEVVLNARLDGDIGNVAVDLDRTVFRVAQIAIRYSHDEPARKNSVNSRTTKIAMRSRADSCHPRRLAHAKREQVGRASGHVTYEQCDMPFVFPPSGLNVTFFSVELIVLRPIFGVVIADKFLFVQEASDDVVVIVASRVVADVEDEAAGVAERIESAIEFLGYLFASVE